MLFRVLYIIALNAAFLIGLIWYLPISSLLEARGYDPDQVEAVEKIIGPGPGALVPEMQPPSAESPDNDEPKGSQAPAESNGADDETTAEDEQSDGADRATNTEPAPRPKLVATSVVNVRAKPTTDGDIVGRVPASATVTVTDDPGGDWVEVDFGDGTGWVYRPLFERAGG